PTPNTMMLIGGTSITRIARFSARWPSLGVLLATALHIAHPCASAGIVSSPTIAVNPTARIFAPTPLMASLMNPQPQNPPRIRKEEEIHNDKARGHRDHQQPAHQWFFKLQVHEVGNDQSRLDHRQHQQRFEHPHRLENLSIAEPDLNGGQKQQRAPHPEILPLAIVRSELFCCGVVHHVFSETSLSLVILSEAKDLCNLFAPSHPRNPLTLWSTSNTPAGK